MNGGLFGFARGRQPTPLTLGALATSASSGKVLKSDGLTWDARQTIYRDTHANRPAAAASNKNALYFETDTLTMFYSDGAAWYDVACIDQGVCEGRLTLTTLVPITTTDVTGASAQTIYFTPYKGGRIALYNGTYWKMYSATSGADFASLALGTLGDGTKPYDIFIYDNAGTLTLEFLVWTSTTARATALVLQDGVYCKTGALTRRYLGTFMPTDTTHTEDSVKNRYVYNYYNRVTRKLLVTDTTSSWTYTSSTWRQARAQTANQVNFVIGFAGESYVRAEVHALCQHSAAGGNGAVGIGVDSTTVNSADVSTLVTQPVNGTGSFGALARYENQTLLGQHSLIWIESVPSNTATLTFFSGAAAGPSVSGLMGSLEQ